MMTFREAVGAMDAEGTYGAKRPSMRGYAYVREVKTAEDGKPLSRVVAIVAADGTESCISLGEDRRTVDAVEGIVLDAQSVEAFVFAQDWELANREELEKSRAGAGRM